MINFLPLFPSPLPPFLTATTITITTAIPPFVCLSYLALPLFALDRSAPDIPGGTSDSSFFGDKRYSKTSNLGTVAR